MDRRDPGSGTRTTFLDVRAFGAVGDGLTDDSAAIRAAFSAVPVGGTVVLSPGAYLCGSSVGISRPMTVVGSGATLIGDSRLDDQALLDVAPATFSRVDILDLQASLPAGHASDVIRLANVQGGRITGVRASGGNRTMFLDDGTNTCFFSDLLIGAGQYGMYCKVDASCAENHMAGIYVYGFAAEPVAGLAFISATAADIGGYYMERVMVAGGGRSFAFGIMADASSSTGMNTSPIYMNECGADSVDTAMVLRNWGNVFSHNGWCHATGTDCIVLDGCSDVQLIAGQIKGGRNAIAFRGAPSGHVLTLRNRIPDAEVTYFIESAAAAPTSFYPAFDDAVGRLTNDSAALTGAVSGTQTFITAPRLRTSRTVATGALVLDNDNGAADERYVRVADGGHIEFLDSSYATVTATLYNNGDFRVSGTGYLGALAVADTAPAQTPGSVIRRMPLYDSKGNLVGYVPVYDSIA